VPDRPSDLAAILTRLRLQPADLTSPAAAAEGQVELLLARVGALTDALRAEPDALRSPDAAARAREEFQTAARLLLADLGFVASHLRGQTNALSDSLTGALRRLHDALESVGSDPGVEL